ncbi:MAG: N-6 DNA methylase [Flavobacteriales bacterium]|nr:MAG: N-6 DNA methylase [Flavobacteriales bacterium]
MTQAKESARKEIAALATRFREQYASYKRSDYNETQVRRDFIDPFFKALGWDVDNSAGNAEAYREVIHEDRVKVGKALKAPDYSFRLEGGKRLFFVEAKKPFVKVKSEIEPAYQVRRYAWSAKLPISILTDFEEFSVYDCTKRPHPEDKAAVARIKYITFEEYDTEFDFLWNTFSKEQVRKGSFDQFIKSDRGKRGTASVDAAFLESLDTWRTYLATSISLKNHDLDEESMNHVVQQTIDRIIFLRIAEDRGVEPYGELAAAIKEGGDLYQNLYQLFRRADIKYNSGLFDFKKDRTSANVVVDNKVVKTIVDELYYPKSPYEFSVLSVEILGSAYEQFLGKRIRIDNGHRARIEEKPEVRKAGGVYYTPQYIVDYIVSQTVGELVKGRTPKEVAELKVLDPACGSGSFLLGAYQFLLDWHKAWYREHAPLKGKKRDELLRPDGELTSAVKKLILTRNIYGVDLDANAVEVTKLSLLLKCMEGETAASIQHSLDFAHERVLPTLDENILWGNSLVDTDYYDSELDFGGDKKIRPFNWQRNFPAVFKIRRPSVQQELLAQARRVKQETEEQRARAEELLRKQGSNTALEPPAEYRTTQGGFDAVIGNPPYVLLQNLETKEFFTYAANRYSTARYKIDTYQLFVERAVNLLAPNGRLGFITPNTFLKNIYAEPMRRLLLDRTKLNQILLFNYSVFAQASVDTCVFITTKASASTKSKLEVFKVDEAFVPNSLGFVPQASFGANQRADFILDVSSADQHLLDKILGQSRPLGEPCGAYFGIQAWDRKKHVAEKKLNKSYRPVVDGADIEAFGLRSQSLFVLFNSEGVKSGGNEAIHHQERICIRQVGHYPIATVIPAGLYAMNSLYNVYLRNPGAEDLYFVLGIINSHLNRFYWKKVHSDQKKTFPKIKKEAILSVPLKVAKTKAELELKGRISSITRTLVTFKNEQFEWHGALKDAAAQDKAAHMEQRINEGVFALYGLTEQEIAVVEGRN